MANLWLRWTFKDAATDPGIHTPTTTDGVFPAGCLATVAAEDLESEEESLLNWLPVCFRIDFKLLLFVFNAINGLAPSYLSEILTICDHGRALRSSGQLLLEVPRSRYKQWGDHSFAVAAPRLWNKLPPDIRTTTDLGLFKSKLKTHFFRLAFNPD